MVVFHGTRNPSLILANGFQPSRGGEFGPGIYLTENPDTAAFYALHVAHGPEAPTTLVTQVDASRFFVIKKVDWIQKTAHRTPSTVQRALQRKGHNGIIGIALNEYERQIVAFDPSSVIGPSYVYAYVYA